MAPLPEIGPGSPKQSKPNRGSHYVGLDLKDAVIASLKAEFGVQASYSDYFRELWSGYNRSQRELGVVAEFFKANPQAKTQFENWIKAQQEKAEKKDQK